MLLSLLKTYRAVRLDGAGCARTGTLRAGEASLPGFRQRRVRAALELSSVSLVEPATAALQDKFWKAFESWVCSAAGEDALEQASRVPELLVELLNSFAQELYDAGTSLHYYRQLVAYTQRKFVNIRPFVRKVWETISKWESLEPVQHRPPLREPLLRALCAVAIIVGVGSVGQL